MPAPLRPQARPTRLLLRPLKPRRTHRLRHLRPQLRLRRGPSGKEAAQPLPPRFQRAEFGTAGCNSGCRFCQNWDIAKARSFDRLGVEASPEKIAQVAADRGIDSVAFTYNDPIVFAEYAIDTAEACRALGIHPIAVTAGYMSAEARPDFYAAMDAANIDLKGFTEEFYWKVTGTHLADVLETIDYAVNEARTPEGEHVWWSSPRYSSLDSTMTTPSCMLNVHGYASTWSGRAAALLRIPPQLPHDGRTAHPARDSDPRPRHRPRRGTQLCVHRQRA